MPQPYVTHAILDHSGEVSTVRHFLPTINGANYAITTGNATPGVQNVASLRVALGAITNGNFSKHTVVSYQQRDNSLSLASLPADAQRESKLLVLLRDDDLGRGFSFEIACPNKTLLAQSGTDEINQTVTEWQDFVAWLETYSRSPWGNNCTVTGGRLVGRSI